MDSRCVPQHQKNYCYCVAEELPREEKQNKDMEERMPLVGSPNYTVFNELAAAIIDGGAIRATKYNSPVETAKATRRKYKASSRSAPIEILFTIGRPNYKEREFIKKCKKAGESFPVKKIQLKFNAAK